MPARARCVWGKSELAEILVCILLFYLALHAGK